VKYVRTYRLWESLFHYETPSAKDIERAFQEDGVLDIIKKYMGTYYSPVDESIVYKQITLVIQTQSKEIEGYHISFTGDSRTHKCLRNMTDDRHGTWVELDDGLIYNSLKNSFPGIEKVWISRFCLEEEYEDKVHEVC